MNPTDFDNWSPLTPQEVATRFRAFPGPWWVAGGWAIDLFIGRQTRPHQDIDIVVLRRDHRALHDVLSGWAFYAVDPPGTLRPWGEGETLPPPIHTVWCRPSPAEPWALQFLIEEAAGEVWRYRRDERIRRPLNVFGERREVIPFVSPEVQLLYKAKGHRPRDEHDFAHALPLLDRSQRDWLATALITTHPDHPWLPHLHR